MRATVLELDEWRDGEDDPGEPPPGRFDDEEAAVDARSLSAACGFAERWVRLDQHAEFLLTEPPRTEWLLTRWDYGKEVGVLPRGKTGLLTGTGGTSKTTALVQLALAVAFGGFWLETFRVTQPGHVLLALGEEDLTEARRRLWRAANSLELSTEQRRAILERIDLVPLHGVPVALTASERGFIPTETPLVEDLLRRLKDRGVNWSLVIFDPLSRFAGGGIESNNEAATRFCQAIERFTAARGSPTVLVAHHSSQNSMRAGESDARGVTAIRDGFRWMATLDVIKEESGGRAIRLRSAKSNYSREFPDLLLLRNTEPGTEGTLRPATALEAKAFDVETKRARVKEEKVTASHEAEQEAVLDVLPLRPGYMSFGAVQDALRARGKSVGEKRLKGMLENLAAEGEIEDLSDGKQATARRWVRRGEA